MRAPAGERRQRAIAHDGEKPGARVDERGAVERLQSPDRGVLHDILRFCRADHADAEPIRVVQMRLDDGCEFLACALRKDQGNRPVWPAGKTRRRVPPA